MNRWRPTYRGCVAVLLPTCGAAGQTCAPVWSDEFPAHTVPGIVRAMEVLSGPSGTGLYVGTVSGEDNARLALFDGNRIRLVGRFAGELVPGGERGVFAITAFDDGGGPVIYVGGDFTAAASVAANGVARLGPQGWSPLGDGVDGTVRTLHIYDDCSGPALYAGGYFSHAAGLPASRLARWGAGAWSPMGTGVTGGQPPFPSSAPAVLALSVFDGGSGPRLIVGGMFDHADGVSAMNIASYGPGGWAPLAQGLSAPTGAAVQALHVSDFEGEPLLYAGGQFAQSGIGALANVARWDGRAWTSVGPGILGANFAVSALATHTIGGVPTLVAGAYAPSGGTGFVYRYDGAAWVWLGSATSGPLRALRSFGPHVYAGGAFQTIGGASAWNLARWDGSWSRLPHLGTNGFVDRFRIIDEGAGPILYMFPGHTIAGQAGAGPARFDGRQWSFMPTTGLSYSISDVAWLDDGTGPMLYAATHFQSGARVGRLNNGAWEPVGLSTSTVFGNGVYVIEAFDDGAGHVLFAGGSGLVAGVRAWDGVEWVIPGGGLPASVGWSVRDFEALDDGAGARLFAVSDSGISRWNTISWEPMALPIPFGPIASTVYDDGAGKSLFLGGHDGILRYDGAWTVLLRGTGLGIWSLAGLNDRSGPALYAGGRFTELGGAAASRIARFGGGTWSALGAGLDDECEALAGYDGALWAGGQFLAAGPFSSGHIARWVACPCYPDCNANGALTVADFGCFQTKFVAGDPYADCNTDGALTVADFGCFQTRFIAGCP